MLIVNSSLITPADTKRLSRSGERYKRYGKQKDEICQLLSHCETICREIESHTENQRISMRIDLEVLNSVDHIITTSIMQSADESVSVRKQAMSRSCIRHSSHLMIATRIESQRGAVSWCTSNGHSHSGINIDDLKLGQNQCQRHHCTPTPAPSLHHPHQHHHRQSHSRKEYL